jgi:hypothetical protein
MLLMLASHPFDADDHIRDYEELLEELERRDRPNGGR